MSEKDNKDLNKDLEVNGEGQALSNEEVASVESSLPEEENTHGTTAAQDAEEAESHGSKHAEDTNYATELSGIAASPDQTNNNGPKKSFGAIGWIATSIVLAVVLVIVLIKPPFAGANNESVASVNGDKITKNDLFSALMTSNKDTVLKTLDDLTNSKLIEQDAKNKNVTVTDEEINKELADVKKNFASDSEFNSAMAQYGLTLETLKEQLRTTVEIRKILGPETKVTDEDIKNYYDQNKETLGTPEEVEASHILVDTEQEAKDIITQLNGGADFAALAKEKSKDTSNKDNGGSLGYFKKGDMDPDFEKAAFSMKVGDTSKEPVKTSYGYHVIKVTGHKDAVIPAFEEEKDTIKATLIDQAINGLYSDWMDGLKAKASITNTLDPASAGGTETTTEEVQ